MVGITGMRLTVFVMNFAIAALLVVVADSAFVMIVSADVMTLIVWTVMHVCVHV